ncbi:hypothetical protein BC828DRAFT_432440 [Blastocladiella britannica]|nr:hypothetical protein BC828DRAFT_432440 [Blastocladiella britannica]
MLRGPLSLAQNSCFVPLPKIVSLSPVRFITLVLLFGLVQALSLTAAWQWSHINKLWDIAACFIAASPRHLHDITGSEFLEDVAIAENTAPAVALDFANAAIALYRQPIPTRREMFWMIDWLLCSPDSAVVRVLFEELDIPSLFARVVAAPRLDNRFRATWQSNADMLLPL